MIRRNGKNELTPSQVDFCKRAIDGFKEDEWRVSLAGRAGSDRRFLRITPGDSHKHSLVLILWDSSDEDWERFININREVSESLQVLPRIYAVDEKHGLLLEEDCGEHTLKDFCAGMKGPRVMGKKYKQVIDALILWQQIDIRKCPEISSRALDKDMFLWETDYFARHCISEYFGLDSILTSEWERERIELARETADLPLVCLHRDFQSENIMVTGDTIRLVDYQGARKGAAEYDLASLLYDPYVSVLDDALRQSLVDYYIKKSGRPVTRHTFQVAALQRLCQALGAYGNLSLHKGKEHYKEYIPVALKNLHGILERVTKYSYLKTIIMKCLERT